MTPELFFSVAGFIVAIGFALWLKSCGETFIVEAQTQKIKAQGAVDEAQLSRRKVALDHAPYA